jgi:mannose-6-phosphate isomerase-like protein (cupin superfamily)
MLKILKLRNFMPAPGTTARFEGEPFGAGVSFFATDDGAGEGPPLHWHPYSETWLVLEGTVRFHLAGDEADAGAGDIFTVPPATPHKFMVTGIGRTRMVCMHPSPRIIQHDLE